jgi:hypothetical protein
MLHNKQVVMLGPDTLSGVTPNPTLWVDTRGFDACTLVLATGVVTDAGDANGFTATLQHSDLPTEVSAEDCVAADSVDGALTAQVTADTDDNVLVRGFGYVGSKRYVRLRFVGTTGTNAVVNTTAVLNKPHRAATTFIGTGVAAT